MNPSVTAPEAKWQLDDVRVPSGAPAWITPELIADTIETWQPYYGKAAQVSSTDAVLFLNEATQFKHIRPKNGEGGVDSKIPNPMTLSYDLDDSGWL